MLLYAFTAVCTELVTNNAAAALSFPIGLSIAENLGHSYKPYIMTIMIAASTSFVTPIGYATNLMVWQPGKYAFSDYFKVGFPLTLIYLSGTVLLAPIFFPLVPKKEE